MRTTMTNTTKITLSLSENDVLDLLALMGDRRRAFRVGRSPRRDQAAGAGAEERHAGLLIGS